uniref:Uncharacterized protein n=1 Tax=Chromera velia CCMP2878 TaxID=1169474 RepID=A0A0G4GU65_9ALVE|eukprot:Cvel_23382.t1-p1 / transcript=Cvel_23382.t1 / gene=Cvel_23382 / organism=Chromera_velia_CCMP2878 / gene_product=NADP-reducing hydrogenase subunit HndC, putative / transcript_product=NADP-reducing hydrogenase subunit HndC, putative / location=Cvel_scaffold2403:3675-9988(-) / protein_length=918 / sequence_SO=supercontig / SO=protein_coding / is_pseudo=false
MLRQFTCRGPLRQLPALLPTTRHLAAMVCGSAHRLLPAVSRIAQVRYQSTASLARGEFKDFAHSAPTPFNKEEDVAIAFDGKVCIECRACELVCPVSRTVPPASGFDADTCIKCGRCLQVCPTGAIFTPSFDIKAKIAALKKQGVLTMAQVAPAIRAVLTDEEICFGLRRLGFDLVFDTNVAADITIMEESRELLERITKPSPEAPLPMFTSCCPAWVNMVEKQYPHLAPHLSTCMSPQAMLGQLVRHQFKTQRGIPPEKIYIASVMPCVAKKDEVRRKQLRGAIDDVITSRELMAQAPLNFDRETTSPEYLKYDTPLDEASGAGKIFGNTGGVMEAAIRTAYWMYTGQEPPRVQFTDFETEKGIREYSIDLDENTTVRAAIVNGTKNLGELLANMNQYHMIEVMNCEGGCVNGPGQPLGLDWKAIKGRHGKLFDNDKHSKYFASHQTPEIHQLYEKELQDAELRHHLFHTHYHPRDAAPEFSVPAEHGHGVAEQHPPVHSPVSGEDLKWHPRTPVDVQPFTEFHNVTARLVEESGARLPLGFSEAFISESRQLTPEGYSPEQFLLRFSAPHNPVLPSMNPSLLHFAHCNKDLPPPPKEGEENGFHYRTGDHIGIAPCNVPAEVDAVLNHFEWDADALVTVKSQDPVRQYPAEPMTVRCLFSQFVDLSGPVGYGVRRLLKPDSGFLPGVRTHGEALMMIPKGVYSISQIVSLSPPIQPRYYSIASSSTRNPRELELLVAKVAGGLATSFMCGPYEMIQGRPIAVRLRRGVFNYPEDPSTPLVAVSVGTGLAPVRSFMLERADRGIQGNCVVIHGCRHKAKDFVCVEDLHSGGAEEYVAFSRDGEKKVYIHDKIVEGRAAIWELLEKPNCQFFYCGAAGKVCQQMEAALFQGAEMLGRTDGHDVIQRMRDEHRYHLEAY